MNNMCSSNQHQNNMGQYNNSYYQPASDSSLPSVPNWQYQNGMNNNSGNWQNNSSQTMNSNARPAPIAPQRAYQPKLLPSRSMSDISYTPETLTNIDFLPAYLSQHVGKWIRADFLVGNSIEQRVGILNEVGASYIIIQAIEPATLIVCDMFSIKFVTIIMDDEYSKLML